MLLLNSYPKTDNCVEVAANDPAAVLVRDSKNRGGAVLRFEPEEWAYFLEEIKR
ncbi:DUF397 domain-containing protein [Nonomuraea longispora]|uniref:DUF397 domain-containing protein n=1 Tax=Nonomuraea longispora TaxID=1848320 RepID=A0A4R4N2G1_9ACTN|nr:DUF397 domain-containing protein [Nonomuraea longispora]TDC02868.1 DUF397 domain-containing protein [Nonomuraea longispora]